MRSGMNLEEVAKLLLTAKNKPFTSEIIDNINQAISDGVNLLFTIGTNDEVKIHVNFIIKLLTDFFESQRRNSNMDFNEFDRIRKQLLRAIEGESTEGLNNTVKAEELQLENDFNDHYQAAYSHGIFGYMPDETGYQLTNDRKQKILDEFEYRSVADCIIRQANFKRLKEDLPGEIISAKFEIGYNKLETVASRGENSSSVECLKFWQILAYFKEHDKLQHKDLPAITNCITAVLAVEESPNEENINNLSRHIEKIHGKNRSWSNVLTGAMLGVLGVAIVAASIGLAVATFGVSTPLSIAGLALGCQIAAVGTLIAAGTIGAGVAVKAGMFANCERKGDLANLAEDVLKKARKNRH